MSSQNHKRAKKSGTGLTNPVKVPKAQSAAENFVTQRSFGADPFGSYTGTAKERAEKPVQDADDL